MIILGDKYTLTELEMKQLSDSFQNIKHISYSGKSAEEIIALLKEEIQQRHVRLIVLNTSAVLPETVIQYMANQEEKGIHYIAIETFLEQYLNKTLLPEDKPSDAYGVLPYTPVQYMIKRTIDYSVGLVIVVLASPVMVYTALRIRRESPGPILFRQKRVGIRGEEFECIKFRSMHLDAEEDGAKFAEEDDPRAFEFGKKIRKYKVDELPQLWNIFWGDMHLVGPRPERPIWVKEFEKSIPHYASRHVVAPGLTGWAQMEYHYGRGEVDARQKLMYDLYYIRNWSLKFDLKIIWRTVRYLIRQNRDR